MSIITRQIIKPCRNSTIVDYNSKIIIVGDSGVGKTNILTRFCSDQFKQTHIATIGVDFNFKCIQLGNKTMKLQVWDTAGQQRFKTITQTYYKNTGGVIIVFGLDNRQSFENVQKWVNNVQGKVLTNAVCIIVGNKKDLAQQRLIFKGEAENLARRLRMKYVQVSAKSSEGINEIFEFLSQRLIKIKSQSEEYDNKIKLSNDIDNNETKKSINCYC